MPAANQPGDLQSSSEEDGEEYGFEGSSESASASQKPAAVPPLNLLNPARPGHLRARDAEVSKKPLYLPFEVTGF